MCAHLGFRRHRSHVFGEHAGERLLTAGVQELESPDDQVVVSNEIDRRPPLVPSLGTLSAIERRPHQPDHDKLRRG
jgi:hypothetical protein